jgi:hypothetical protein
MSGGPLLEGDLRVKRGGEGKVSVCCPLGPPHPQRLYYLYGLPCSSLRSLLGPSTSTLFDGSARHSVAVANLFSKQRRFEVGLEIAPIYALHAGRLREEANGHQRGYDCSSALPVLDFPSPRWADCACAQHWARTSQCCGTTEIAIHESGDGGVPDSFAAIYISVSAEFQAVNAVGSFHSPNYRQQLSF